MANDYIVHKAVELKNVKKKLVPSERELTHNYLCQPKYDGCNMVAKKYTQAQQGDIIEGQVALRSRTDEPVRSAGHIESAIALAPFMPLGVYLGEYWHPFLPQNEISGKFRDTKQQHEEPFFVVFDYLTHEEFDNGYSPLSYTERVARIPPLFFRIEEFKSPVFPAESQGYLVDQELTPMEAARTLSEAGNYDGIILRKPDGTWTRGRGTDGEVIKIKPTLTLDLRVLRQNSAVGEKTGRDVYTIVVQLPDGKEQEVGSGIPHTLAAVPHAGDIVEIEAMSYSKNGLLREPRFKGIRHDKTEPDA